MVGPMPAPKRSIQILRSYRPAFLAACLAAGLGLGAWIDGAASSRSQPETPTSASKDAELAPVATEPVAPAPAKAPPLDPAVRYANIATLISSLEGRIEELRAEHARLDRLQISFDRKPDYRESTSEVEFRGRRSMQLTYRKVAIEREIEGLERRINELRIERERLACRHGFE